MKLKTHLLLEFCQKMPFEATCTQAIIWSLSSQKKRTPKLPKALFISQVYNAAFCT